MRILHISTRLILGGSQENTILSCEGQARLGHDVHLAFGPIYGPEGSLLDRVQSFRTDDGRGITTHTIPHMIREVSPWHDLLAKRELRRLIRTIKPDIVHTHSSKAGILGRAAAWTEWSRLRKQSRSLAPDQTDRLRDRLHIGIVHTIHGPPFMPIEGSPSQRLKIRLNNAIYTRAERYAARRCHTIVSVADAMTRQFLARGIGRPEQYTTVYSGMEVERYLSPAWNETRSHMRRNLGFADNDIVIGTVARLAQHKGHDDLLDALAGELRHRPNLKLLWVGDGWWRERLLAKARDIGITIRELDRERSPAGEHESERAGERESERHAPAATPSLAARLNPFPHNEPQLFLTGLVPPESVPAHIRAMDILAHPSYREGLPRTIPQALLCGIAPVAYDIDGTGEVCRDGQTGRLVPPGNTLALRDAIMWLAQQPLGRERLAAAGREWCRERFSAQTMVQELERVYAQALERARG